MRKFDCEIKRNAGGRETLPAGGYVCQIVNAGHLIGLLVADLAQGFCEGFVPVL